jgi:2-keto-3-deoxy-6-phosphogluconate aldolase
MAAQPKKAPVVVTPIRPSKRIAVIPTAGIEVFNISEYLSASIAPNTSIKSPIPFMRMMMAKEWLRVKSRNK